MKRLLIAATALTLLSSGAYAQSYSDSGSNASATNSSASLSSSVSNPQVNVIGNPIGNGASSSYSNSGASANTRSSSLSSVTGNKSIVRNTTNIVLGSGSGLAGTTAGTKAAGTNAAATNAAGTSAADPSGTTATGGGGDPTINYSGGYTVRNTPEVIPPSVVGGNTCAVGASAGVALPGFGIAGGATWADKACERRQQAALLYNMGDHRAAFALMCQDDHVRQAMGEVGEPCLQDRRAAAVQTLAPPPAVAAAPAVAAPVPVAAPTSTAEVVTPQPKPRWCTAGTVSPRHLNSLSEGQRLYVRLHCGV